MKADLVSQATKRQRRTKRDARGAGFSGQEVVRGGVLLLHDDSKVAEGSRSQAEKQSQKEPGVAAARQCGKVALHRKGRH